MFRKILAALAALSILSLPSLALADIRLPAKSEIAFAFDEGGLPFEPNLHFHLRVQDLALPVQIEPDLSQRRPQARPASFAHKTYLAGLPLTLDGASEFYCMAVTLYHEARGEGIEGMAAVATVVHNRVRAKNRWGDSICQVTVPVQFSYLNKDKSFAPIDEYEAWIVAMGIAAISMLTGPQEHLQGADHYHTKAVNPSWSGKMPMVDSIGFHLFYADPTTVQPA